MNATTFASIFTASAIESIVDLAEMTYNAGFKLRGMIRTIYCHPATKFTATFALLSLWFVASITFKAGQATRKYWEKEIQPYLDSLVEWALEQPSTQAGQVIETITFGYEYVEEPTFTQATIDNCIDALRALPSKSAPAPALVTVPTTIRDLRRLAQLRSIPNYSRMSKQALMEVLGL